jgi:N-acetylneuraminate synthase
MIDRNIFDELFVLEMANNHWGDVNRGLKMVKDFSKVARYNGVRCAIKLQFRDVDTFIHRDFRERRDIRYVAKTLDTQLAREDFAVLAEAVRKNNCIRMATPFDEKSVDLCEELGIQIIKIASSDVNDWPLIERIAKAKKPVIFSTGGSNLKDIDDLVTFFDNRQIPVAINHCVSLYPSEESEMQLNQIDFLKSRYPNHTIGLSTHEHRDPTASLMIAYAKGARTFERHIDLHTDDHPITPYCATPPQVDTWIQSFKRARSLCGAPGISKAEPSAREINYLDTLVRGVYARRDLPAGHAIQDGDYYLAIPLQKGQISCRELTGGEPLLQACAADAPLTVDHFDTPYAREGELRAKIQSRGL